MPRLGVVISTVSGASYKETTELSRVATYSADKTVRVYTLKIEELGAISRTRVTRNLTLEECKKYLHTDERSPLP